jgi:hypothetical protein
MREPFYLLRAEKAINAIAFRKLLRVCEKSGRMGEPR